VRASSRRHAVLSISSNVDMQISGGQPCYPSAGLRSIVQVTAHRSKSSMLLVRKMLLPSRSAQRPGSAELNERPEALGKCLTIGTLRLQLPSCILEVTTPSPRRVLYLVSLLPRLRLGLSSIDNNPALYVVLPTCDLNCGL